MKSNQIEKQMVVAKIKYGSLFKKFPYRAFISDDASYFRLTHSTFNDNCGYYKFYACTTEPIIEFTTKAKLEGKILVWAVMGSKGLSRPFIRMTAFAVNGKRHLHKNNRRRPSPASAEITVAVITNSGQTWPAVITTKSFASTSANKTSLS